MYLGWGFLFIKTNNYMSHYNWKKGKKINLSPNFSTAEFECSCKLKSCSTQLISIDLINKLQELREALGSSISVTSGYRCPEHNKAIGGATASQHMLGNAADIKSKDLDILYDQCEEHFEAIGDGRNKGFIHVDTRSGRPRRWNY